jgi:hypothetical protein
METQVKAYWCDGHSSRIPRTPSTLDHMLFFGKSKSTPNLHQQNPVPQNNLKECLKIEHLMEDIHQECYEQLLLFFSSSLTCDCLMFFTLLILTQVYLQEYMSYQTHVQHVFASW